MNNKIIASLAVLLLCKSLMLAAGGAQGKTQRYQEQEQRKRSLQTKTLLNVVAIGHITGLKAMLASGIDVNIQGEHGITALMLAVEWRRFLSMHLLVSHGACVNQTDSNGDSAITRILTKAVDKETRKSVLRFLVKNSKCTHSVQTQKSKQSPQEILASYQAIDSDYARTKAAFLAEAIEDVEDARRATVAEFVLSAHSIFPLEIIGEVQSFISADQETRAERARTLRELAELNQKSSNARRIQ